MCIGDVLCCKIKLKSIAPWNESIACQYENEANKENNRTIRPFVMCKIVRKRLPRVLQPVGGAIVQFYGPCFQTTNAFYKREIRQREEEEEEEEKAQYSRR